MKGGKVIASGTYGCILNPALPCKGETTRPVNSVSKLMMKEDAENEMSEINGIAELVKKVPNYNDHYVISNISICDPSELTKDDLKDYKTKCSAMNNKKIKHNNVNNPNNLNRLKILQLSDGGKDISTYFARLSKSFDPVLFKNINNALIKLLKGGVEPLNGLNVLHQDIKSSNIVFSERDDTARLIDWGISTILTSKKVPDDVSGWPIMFNQPFSNILFHSDIQDVYKSITMNTTHALSATTQPQPLDMIDLHKTLSAWLEKIIFENKSSIMVFIGGEGHLSYLQLLINTIDKLFNNSVIRPGTISNEDKALSKTPIVNIICDYLSKALLTFSQITSKSIEPFRENDYFNEVYRHNCDIHGFISTYADLVINGSIPENIRIAAAKLIVKYNLSNTYSDKKIPVSDVIRDCKDLNDIVFIQSPRIIIPPGVPVKIPSSKTPIPLKAKKERRCPNGTRRNKKTGNCDTVILKRKTQTKAKTPVVAKAKKERRCPNGTRRNKKTGNCDTLR